jgi:hypothetical protein
MKDRINQFLLLLLIFACLFSSSLSSKLAANPRQTGFCERFKPCQLLGQTEAEKILGQAVRPGGERSELKGEVRQCTCDYGSVADANMHLYFAVEQGEPKPSAEQAQQVMATTKADNAHDLTITDLTGIGDEAFLLGDQPGRPFIMARKGPVVIRLQIREAREANTLEKLKAFAREVAKRF